MDYKKMIQQSLQAEISDCPVVKSVVIQDLIYPGTVEQKCFCEGGAVYARLCEGENEMTGWVLVPPQKEIK